MDESKVHKFQSVNSAIFYGIVRENRWDFAIAIALATIAGFASYYGGQYLYPQIVNPQAMDVWFQNDAPRVFLDMTDYGAPHDRTTVHPLFVLLVFPLIQLVKTAFFLTPMTAVRIVLAGVSSLWIGSLFTIFRLIDCRQFDAILLSLLGAISAASVFWLAVPDTYPFGGLTILLGLGFVALTQYRKFSPLWYVVAGVLTLGITVTNWMVAICATIVSHPWKKALQVICTTWASVVLLVLAQKVIFPTTNAGFILFHKTIKGEKNYINLQDLAGLMKVIQSLVFHTIVMPGIEIVKDFYNPNLLRISVQVSLPGSGSLWGKVAVLLWIALLSLSVWGLFSSKKHLRLRIVLGLTLLGQLALHLVYGTDETFLYALHFVPLLLVLAAFSMLTPARPLALVLTGMLVLSAGINNILEFNRATAFFDSYRPAEKEVQIQMQMHSNRQWLDNTNAEIAGTNQLNLAD